MCQAMPNGCSCFSAGNCTGLCWFPAYPRQPLAAGCIWVPRETLSVSQMCVGLADPWETRTALQQQPDNKRGVVQWLKKH